jgi:drug/metabolite transporter (DMT)-like permease
MAAKGPGKAALVAAFYFLCSISMNFLNKAVVSSYEFNYPFFIMSCQMVVTVIVLDLLRIFRLIKLPAYTLKDGVEFLPCSLSFALHSTLSLIALHGMNIPMYGAIKRCTPLVNLVLSVVVLKKAYPSALLTSSIGIITLGAFVASLGDFQFDLHSYSMGGLSVFAQAAYLTLVQRSSEVQHRTTVEMLHVNSFNTLPIFLTVSMIVGEPQRIGESLSVAAPGFTVVFVLLILSGCVLTWSQFMCAAVCSALTTSMISVAKSVIQTGLGFFTFGGVKFHPLNITGIPLHGGNKPTASFQVW